MTVEVLGLRSDAMAEPGNPLAFILFNAPHPNAPDPDDGKDYPE